MSMTQGSKHSLAGVALLSDLPTDYLAEVERVSKWRRYRSNEQVFDRLSDGTDVYFVVSGKVQILNYSPSGREISFAEVDRGGSFGELSAIDGRTRSATAVAAEDSLLASLSAQRFRAVLLEQPVVALSVLSNVGDMVRSADARIMDLSTLSAINRVHTELLRMAKADDNVGVIKPIPTHSEIAARASTTRETVSRVLSHLARICIMERTARELRVLDLDRLKDLIEPAND